MRGMFVRMPRRGKTGTRAGIAVLAMALSVFAGVAAGDGAHRGPFSAQGALGENGPTTRGSRTSCRVA